MRIGMKNSGWSPMIFCFVQVGFADQAALVNLLLVIQVKSQQETGLQFEQVITVFSSQAECFLASSFPLTFPFLCQWVPGTIWARPKVTNCPETALFHSGRHICPLLYSSFYVTEFVWAAFRLKKGKKKNNVSFLVFWIADLKTSMLVARLLQTVPTKSTHQRKAPVQGQKIWYQRLGTYSSYSIE